MNVPRNPASEMLETVTAVIVNWRTAELTQRAVQSLIADGVPSQRIVVVDNGSNDGSVERLEAFPGGCLLLPLERNLGYGAASNAAAAALPGSAYLVLNSDAFAYRPGSVASLMRALGDPEIGIAVPRLLNEDLTLQPSVVPRTSPLSELVRALGLSRLFPNDWQPFLSTHWDHRESRCIQAAVGAVLLVRGETWHQLRGFDERRFMYAEDLDLFWRAHELGWRTHFVSKAEFVHLGNASAQQRWSDPDRALRVARAEAELVRDHLARLPAGLSLFFLALGAGMRALIYLLARNRAAADTQRSLLRGYLAGAWATASARTSRS